MDFAEGTNFGNETVVASTKKYVDDVSIGGVTCVKWQPALIAQDLCSELGFCLSLFIEPWWQFFMPAMSSKCIDDTTECETHDVAQIAASTGLEANARIKTIAVVRKNFILH